MYCRLRKRPSRAEYDRHAPADVHRLACHRGGRWLCLPCNTASWRASASKIAGHNMCRSALNEVLMHCELCLMLLIWKWHPMPAMSGRPRSLWPGDGRDSLIHRLDDCVHKHVSDPAAPPREPPFHQRVMCACLVSLSSATASTSGFAVGPPFAHMEERQACRPGNQGQVREWREGRLDGLRFGRDEFGMLSSLITSMGGLSRDGSEG